MCYWDRINVPRNYVKIREKLGLCKHFLEFEYLDFVL